MAQRRIGPEPRVELLCKRTGTRTRLPRRRAHDLQTVVVQCAGCGGRVRMELLGVSLLAWRLARYRRIYALYITIGVVLLLSAPGVYLVLGSEFALSVEVAALIILAITTAIKRTLAEREGVQGLAALQGGRGHKTVRRIASTA